MTANFQAIYRQFRQHVRPQAANQNGQITRLGFEVFLDDVGLKFVRCPTHGFARMVGSVAGVVAGVVGPVVDPAADGPPLGRPANIGPRKTTHEITIAGPQIQLRMGVRKIIPPTTKTTVATTYAHISERDSLNRPTGGALFIASQRIDR